MKTCDKQLAEAGLLSFRYKGRYGWIMIGAKSTVGALVEAQRSLNDGIAIISNLQEWNGEEYVQSVYDEFFGIIRI